MLELARGISQWAHGFKRAVIFLFNTGEEEGLNGAHSFITQVWNCLPFVNASLYLVVLFFLICFENMVFKSADYWTDIGIRRNLNYKDLLVKSIGKIIMDYISIFN